MQLVQKHHVFVFQDIMIPNQSVRKKCISKRHRGNLMNLVLQSLDHFVGPKAGELTTVILFIGVTRTHELLVLCVVLA